MMLALILARAGVEVILLEKHNDFIRDFRGDTIHPSTLDLIDQLGLRPAFEAIPHTTLETITVVVNGTGVSPISFRSLRGPNKHIAMMPQWDLLNLLAEEAQRYPNFRLLMGTEATGLLRAGGFIAGVSARGADGDIEVRAPLTVAADGRTSTVRAAAKLKVREYGVPIDVLWFQIPKPAVNPPTTFGYANQDGVFITIPRVGYYQTARLIAKDGFTAMREAGLPQFRRTIVEAAPFLSPVVHTLEDWEQVKLLSVRVNRLRRWHRSGLLCIGDAAHAMSPAGGVGINYAVQDAVATANRLADRLLSGTVRRSDLAAIQRRRYWPAAVMQTIQLGIHRVVARSGQGRALPNPASWPLKMVFAVMLPIFRPIGARVVGRGFRPERIDSHLLAGPPAPQ